MPLYSLSDNFKKILKKKNKKANGLASDVTDALRKFEQNPVPSSLDFKPVPGSTGRYYIYIPKRHGWRIIFRKTEYSDQVVYEAIDVGNHDIRREGNK